MTDSVTEPPPRLGTRPTPAPRALLAPLAHLAWREVVVAARRRRRPPTPAASCSTCPTGRATSPASTSTCGSPHPTATRPPAATRCRPGRARHPRSPCRRSRTARCPPTWCATSPSATPSGCAARSAGTSSGRVEHRPLLLVGGGSGLAPLRAMWRAADPTAPVVVLASVTTPHACCTPPSSPTGCAPARARATVPRLPGRAVPPDAVRPGYPARRADAPVAAGSTRHPSRPPSRLRRWRMPTRPCSSADPTSFVEAAGRAARRRRPRPARGAGRALRLTPSSHPTGVDGIQTIRQPRERQVVTMSDHVDGNAVIGALSLALGTDVGEGSLECAGCGDTHEIARTHVYLRCPGMVLRCPGCGAVEVVVVEIRHRLTATLSGVAALRTRPTGRARARMTDPDAAAGGHRDPHRPRHEAADARRRPRARRGRRRAGRRPVPRQQAPARLGAVGLGAGRERRAARGAGAATTAPGATSR